MKIEGVYKTNKQKKFFRKKSYFHKYLPRGLCYLLTVLIFQNDSFEKSNFMKKIINIPSVSHLDLGYFS